MRVSRAESSFDGLVVRRESISYQESSVCNVFRLVWNLA